MDNKKKRRLEGAMDHNAETESLKPQFAPSVLIFPMEEMGNQNLNQALEQEWRNWISLDLWTMEECTYLLSGLLPDRYALGPLDQKRVEITRKQLLTSIEAGNLKMVSGKINPQDLAHWAIKKGIELPEEMMPLLNDLPQVGKPPYLDKEHIHYTEELEACVAAWMAVCASGEQQSKMKAQIEDWLKENRRGLTNEALNRISTVVNPNIYKKGGAPKTSY